MTRPKPKPDYAEAWRELRAILRANRELRKLSDEARTGEVRGMELIRAAREQLRRTV